MRSGGAARRAAANATATSMFSPPGGSAASTGRATQHCPRDRRTPPTHRPRRGFGEFRRGCGVWAPRGAGRAGGAALTPP
eukprot:scaffold110101_cov65-Phaeocystis_antarctica.AAC.1